MDFDAKFDHRMPEEQVSFEKLNTVLLEAGYFSTISNIEQLSGGYSHFNFKFVSGDSSYVLRISDKPQREFESENSILQKLQAVIPVPKVIFSEVQNSILGKHIAIQEFIPGQLLSKVEDTMGEEGIATIGYQLGEILAKVHAFEFEKAGFFGKNLVIEEPFSSFEEGYFGYMDQCLHNNLLRERLGLELYEKLAKFVSGRKGICGSLLQTKNLTHSDFNQKNILVEQSNGEWSVSGIMDWEFAYSGCPLGDFGNFFRYEKEMSPHFRKPLVEAYKQNGGVLSENWREQAHYLDLLPIIQFLIREGEYPKTFETAKSVIESTLFSFKKT